ncbi:MAG: ROK family protein [Adhaeribacter sp.]
MCDSIVLGVDIGGTHITVAGVDFQTTALRPGTWARQQVNSQAPAGEVIGAWARVIASSPAWQPGTPARLGISLPGPFDYEQGISLIRHQDKFEALYGLNVKRLLAEQLGLSPDHILLHNDAACFLKGEAFGGAAKEAEKAIGLTLGTGLGSARLQAGQATDADLWQSPFLDSIAEDYLSTRALVNNYRRRSGRQVKDVEQLASLYAGDVHAREAFRDFGKNLALFLASFIRAEQPEVVVIGGNIARAWDLFMPEAGRHLADLAPPVALRPAQLGETAAMMGAASYWQQVAAT